VIFITILLLFFIGGLNIPKRLNILRLIIISFKNKLRTKISRLNLLTQVIILTDIFIEFLQRWIIDSIYKEFGLYYLYAPT